MFKSFTIAALAGYASAGYYQGPPMSQEKYVGLDGKPVHVEEPASISAAKIEGAKVTPNTASNGWASSTRYWDCSGGSCGCGFGDPNHAVHCHSNAMFAAPAGNQYGAKFYGSAAISQ